MSKESISRDRWRQLGQSHYADWCPGCGLYAYCNNNKHRADCTATLADISDDLGKESS